MNSVIFVCFANACRSQMAEGFARHYGKKDLFVYSAGSRPLGVVLPETVQAMKEKGIDISKHKSKGIPIENGFDFDLAVLMGCGDNCPTVKAKKKIVWEIPDPVGKSPDYFRSTRDLIEEKVLSLLKENGVSKKQEGGESS